MTDSEFKWNLKVNGKFDPYKSQLAVKNGLGTEARENVRLAYAKLGHAASHEEQLAFTVRRMALKFSHRLARMATAMTYALLRDPGSVNRILLQAYVEGKCDLPPPVADEGCGIDDAAMEEHKLEKWIENVPNYLTAPDQRRLQRSRVRNRARKGWKTIRKHARFIEKVRPYALHWQETMIVAKCAPGGAYRAADLAAYSAEFD